MLPMGSLVFFAANPDQPPAHLRGLTERSAELEFRGRADLLLASPAQLASFPLLVGMDVDARIDGSWQRGTLIEAVPSVEGLRSFILRTETGEEGQLTEADLSRIETTRDTQDAFATLRWDSARNVRARRGLREAIGGWYYDSEGLPTLTGARVHPRVHQTYATHRILTDPTPRFLLADEVGLGKTIEAGLVIQAMCSANPETTVLVIAPGSMTRQWQCEIYLRCGGHAFRVASDPADALAGSRVIVSTTALVEAPERWRELADRRWDLVVIDEAHHHPPGSSLYPTLRRLAELCRGILVLSATPSQGQLTGLVGLLSLVTPSRYAPNDTDALQQRYDMRTEVWNSLRFSLDIQASDGETEATIEDLTAAVEEWEDLLKTDRKVLELCRSVREGSRTSFGELMSYIQERYRVDHRIIRTRRRTLRERDEPFAERTGLRLDYSPTAAEALLAQHLDRLDGLPAQDRALVSVLRRSFLTTPTIFLDRLESRKAALTRGPSGDADSMFLRLKLDPGPREEADLFEEVLNSAPAFANEADWLASAIDQTREWATEGQVCARHGAAIEWIHKELRNDPGIKFLVFAEHNEVVEEFVGPLNAATNRHVEMFTWADLEGDQDRMREAADRFQRREDRAVLVCDETGGEGRNFQIASAVIHLDCSWSVARMEQRIGRLDRLGRDHTFPVRSIYLVGPSAVEQTIADVHEHAFDVHRRSIGGLEFVLPELQSQIWDVACGGGERMAESVRSLTESVAATLETADEEYEQAYDTAFRELEAAKEINDALVYAEDDYESRIRCVRRWAKALDVGVHTLREPENGILFRWTEPRVPLPGMKKTGVYSGTFSREAALADESLQFFAPGHKLVDSLIRALDIPGNGIGRCTVFARRLAREYRGRLFLVGSIACRLDLSANELPPGLLTRALRRLAPSSFEFAVELLPGPDPAVEPADRALSNTLRAEFESRADREISIAHLQQIAPLFELRQTMDLAVTLGFETLRLERETEVEDARDELAADLANELAFLHGVVARKEPGHEEAVRGIADRGVMIAAVEQETRALDSLSFIVGV